MMKTGKPCENQGVTSTPLTTDPRVRVVALANSKLAKRAAAIRQRGSERVQTEVRQRCQRTTDSKGKQVCGPSAAVQAGWNCVSEEIPIGHVLTPLDKATKLRESLRWISVGSGSKDKRGLKYPPMSVAPSIQSSKAVKESSFMAFVDLWSDEEALLDSELTDELEFGCPIVIPTLGNAGLEAAVSSLENAVKSPDKGQRGGPSVVLPESYLSSVKNVSWDKQGRQNASPTLTAAETVADMLDSIGVGCPGWNTCSISKLRKRADTTYSPTAACAEEDDDLRAFRKSHQEKAACLKEHADNSDFDRALDEHDAIVSRQIESAVSQLATAMGVVVNPPEETVQPSDNAADVLRRVLGGHQRGKFSRTILDSRTIIPSHLREDPAERSVRLDLRRDLLGYSSPTEFTTPERVSPKSDRERKGSVMAEINKECKELPRRSLLSLLTHGANEDAYRRATISGNRRRLHNTLSSKFEMAAHRASLIEELTTKIRKLCAKTKHSEAPRAKSVAASQLETVCKSLSGGVAMVGVLSKRLQKHLERFVVDSGCNVHLKGGSNPERGLVNATTVHIEVKGTAGVSKVTKTGTVIGTAVDLNGDTVEFRFQCGAMPGLSMNLLSVSQLFTEGSVVHLEKGNSYILVKDPMSGVRRKVVLEEENGLFFLPLMMEGFDKMPEAVKIARANLALASKTLVNDFIHAVTGGAAARLAAATDMAKSGGVATGEATTTDTETGRGHHDDEDFDGSVTGGAAVGLAAATDTKSGVSFAKDDATSHTTTSGGAVAVDATATDMVTGKDHLGDKGLGGSAPELLENAIHGILGGVSITRQAMKNCAYVGSNAATLELWHQRAGCASQKISLMHSKSSVLGLNVSGSPKAGCKKGCKCEVCLLSRACKISPSKEHVFERECSRAFGVVSSDIKGPLLESHCGLRYSIVFIDQVTNMAKTYYMSQKSDAADKLRKYLAWVRHLGWHVGLIRTDRGGEYFGLNGDYVQKDVDKTFTEFERVAEEHGVCVEAAPRDGQTGNGQVERYHRTIFEMASTFLRRSRISPLFWVEAYKYAEFLYNRMTTARTGDFTPYELVLGKRPRFDRVKVFGCDMYEHLDHLPKVVGGTKARKGFFFGLPEDSPSGYLMYDVNAGIVRTVYSASFDESFVRRACGIRVYDKAREIDSAKRKGKALGHKCRVTSAELIFEAPDDILLTGIARQQLQPLDTNQPASALLKGGDLTVVSNTKTLAEPETTGKKAAEKSKGNSRTMTCTEAVGKRVAKEFGQGIFLGNVTEYLAPTASDECPLWQIVYDDGDEEQWELADLKAGIKLCESRTPVGLYAVEDAKPHLKEKKVKRFKKCNDGSYDFEWVAAEDLTKSELEEYKLYLLTQDWTHADEKEDDVTEINHAVDGPLGSIISEREEKRRDWENNNYKIRPFRPFSAGVGRKRALSEEDRLFLIYALENNIPMKYVWRNPKREATKTGECEAYKRYEKYKSCEALRDVINVSILSKGKNVKSAEARKLAMRDIRWDYERGYLYFPLNESGRTGHWVNAEAMSNDMGLTGEAMRHISSEATKETALSGIRRTKVVKLSKLTVFNEITKQWVKPDSEVVTFDDVLSEAPEAEDPIVMLGEVPDKSQKSDDHEESNSETRIDEDLNVAIEADDLTVRTGVDLDKIWEPGDHEEPDSVMYNAASLSFGDVLDKQYEPEKVEWYHDPVILAHLANASLQKVLYRDRDSGVLHEQPNTVPEAMKGPDAERWRGSMEKEIKAMSEFDVWEDVLDMDIPKGTRLLGTKWVLKIKNDKDGYVERFKSRLVVLGYQQREHIHYDPMKTYSPVMSYDSFRMILSIGAALDWEIRSADITSAFLQGNIDRDLYMRHPLGERRKDGSPKVVKLLKGQYGLIQSPRLFTDALQKRMREGGLVGSTFDPCVWRATHSRQYMFDEMGCPAKHREFVEADPEAEESCIIGTWVDDISSCGSSNLILDWFIWLLRGRFTINEKATGECEYMLSARIVRDRKKGLLYLDQSAAITRLAEKCGLANDNPSRRYYTPMTVELPLKHTEKTTDYDYLSVVGAALHICGVSRPDCSFAIGCLARHSKTAGEEHVEALERLVSYMYQTRFKAITYRTSADGTNIPVVYENGVHPLDVDKKEPMKVFVDSDFAGTDGRSTAGYVVFLNGGPVIWSSKLMKVAATSSAEAEVIAAVESVKTASHFRQLLNELGICKSGSIDVREDNKACKESAESLRCHKRARHYQGKLRYLQDCHQNGSIKFHQTPTDEMTADIFTKSLRRTLHERHMNEMLSDLPSEIAAMTKSSISTSEPSSSVEKGNISEDCELALEGGPELEGSPCTFDNTDVKPRVLEYACLGCSDLGTEFLEILVLNDKGG